MKPGKLRNFLSGFCEVADGLVSILSLGTLYPNLAFRFLASMEMRYIKKLKSKTKEERNG